MAVSERDIIITLAKENLLFSDEKRLSKQI